MRSKKKERSGRGEKREMGNFGVWKNFDNHNMKRVKVRVSIK